MQSCPEMPKLPHVTHGPWIYKNNIINQYNKANLVFKTYLPVA